MRNPFFNITLGCFLSILVLSNCHKTSQDNQCLSYATTPIMNVTGPTSGIVNQYIHFTVTFAVCGCGKFENFGQTSDGDTTTIFVNLKYTGCVCPDYCRILDTAYLFKASQPGTYYLKFSKAGDAYITDTIRIQ